jgi:hypothetical protein
VPTVPVGAQDVGTYCPPTAPRAARLRSKKGDLSRLLRTIRGRSPQDAQDKALLSLLITNKRFTPLALENLRRSAFSQENATSSIVLGGPEVLVIPRSATKQVSSYLKAVQTNFSVDGPLFVKLQRKGRSYRVTEKALCAQDLLRIVTKRLKTVAPATRTKRGR